MKPLLAAAALSLCGTLTLVAATAPIFINDAPVQSPPAFLAPIDATSFLNRSIFSVSTTLPFETQNTVYYTNSASGVMSGFPGFRFIFTTNGFRYPAARIVNQGSISVGSYLNLRATNIVNTGPIDCGELGLVRLEGGDVDVRRTGVRAGPPVNGFQFFGGFNFQNNYINDSGVSDLYWGAGDNNRLNNSGRPMRLDTFDPDFSLPFPSSPLHAVIDTTFGIQFTNLVQVPSFFGGFGFGGYTAFAISNRVTATSSVIQVVFVPTNNIDGDTNITTSVQFDSFFQADIEGASSVTVRFSAYDFDIATRSFITNELFLIDTMPIDTNLFLKPNQNFPTRRPSNYEVTRTDPNFGFGFSNPGNIVFTPDLLYNPSYRSNAVPVRYAGYSAVLSLPGRAATNVVPTNPSLADPTNFAGRVEILGNKVNLDQSRLRAESTIVIRAADLSSNRVAQVDAPFLVYDLTSTQPQLVITNLAPPVVRRFQGTIAAWSGLWRNSFTNVTLTATNGTPVATNLHQVDFHVLIVDQQLTSLQTVNLHTFNVHATNLVLVDNLSIGTRMLLDAEAVNIRGTFSPPFGASWAATNVLRVRNFTNDGVLNLTGSGKFGVDRFNATNGAPVPYDNFINRGSVSAASVLIRTLNFENTGSPLATDSGSLRTSGGIFQLETVTGRLTDGTLAGSGDVLIFANDLTLQNSRITAGSNSPGALIIAVTNTLTDGGGNEWFASAGFQMLRRPTGPGRNDLLGVTLQSTAALDQESFHVWAAENRAADASGFTNNLALGRLILDGGLFSLFTFSGGGTNDALYVDYLDLRNSATNYDNALQINPGLTIYFANASVPPEKLDGRQGGRLRWVSNFAGPNSSTNIMYPSGSIFTFNIALVQSRDLDSDGDGIVNADDPTPIPVPGDVGMRIANAAGGGVQVSWTAPPDKINHLEYQGGMNTNAWLILTNVPASPVFRPVSVHDPVPGTQHMRIYRVRLGGP